MGQQPNIQIDQSDAPRTKAAPGVARSWKPSRPGELSTPDQVPSGGAFGVVGPDSGYALRLAAEKDLKPLPGEHHHDVEIAVAAIASARAAGFARFSTTPPLAKPGQPAPARQTATAPNWARASAGENR